MKRVLILTLVLICISAWAAVDETQVMSDAIKRVAEMLGKPESDVAFSGLKVASGKLGIFVCGMADGKRFVDGPAGRGTEPILEGKYSESLFNMVWNGRCAGMSDTDSINAFKRDIDEEICAVKQWNWVTWGTTSIQIQGLATCNTGRILVKAFEGDKYLGSGEGRIEGNAFTVYIDRRPKGSSLRIETATGK